MSTAVERVFIERGDFTVFHEEFAYVYFMHEQRANIPHKNPQAGHPQTYPDIRDMMERARTEKPVFHKDFAYHVLDHLLGDPAYLRGQVNTFLIRHPEQAVLSHATVHPALTREVLGYQQLGELFEHVCRLSGDTPVVIDAEDLAGDPAGTIAAYCAAIGIEFRPEALSWNAGDRKEWATWQGWHNDVAASTGLRRPTGNYLFTYDDMPHLRDYVDYCLPYYEALRELRLRPAQQETLRS